MTTQTDRRTIGVLGGMGPQATVDFLGEIVARTPARGDEDHVRVLVDSNPGVPDRQRARFGDDAPVRRALVEMAQGLARQGADFLVMPCNTAHAFVSDAAAAVAIPFVSIIDVTVAAARNAVPHARRAGLLATDACVAAGLYQDRASANDLELIVPDDAGQAACMRLIAAVKAGDLGESVRAEMAELARSLGTRGAEILIAGCTEIPLVIEGDAAGVSLISSTDELAQRAVDHALGRLPLPVSP